MEEDEAYAEGADVADGNEEDVEEHGVLCAVVGKFGKNGLLRYEPAYEDTCQDRA